MKDQSEDLAPSHRLRSTPEEVLQMANELSEEYSEFLHVDTSLEKKKYEDSIEECLAHLEEVISTIEDYKRNSKSITAFVDIVDNKKDSLEKLYGQVDALEQYMFEASRLLDQLEGAMKELESYMSTGGNKVQQIIGLISSFSRFSFFNSGIAAHDDSSTSEESIPVDDILNKIGHVEGSISIVTSSLRKRLMISSLQE